jgi:hypothetical protein
MKKFVLIAFVIAAFTAGSAAFAFTRTSHNRASQAGPYAASDHLVAVAPLGGALLTSSCEQQKFSCDLLAY